MISLLSLTQQEYADAIEKKWGKGRSYAEKIYSTYCRTGRILESEEWIDPQGLSLFRNILQHTSLANPSISQVQEEVGVKKFLLRHADGLKTESVILPMKFGFTLCVSSQVGCQMGCAFCETGKMGLLRSLTTEEILLQLFTAQFLLQAKIRNVVFMGMGEPFDNYEAVMQAIRIMTDSAGFSLAHSRITVSTSGRVQEIKRFTKDAHPKVNLAISLNAPNDLIRSKLMPINKQFSLADLKQAMSNYPRKILIEYVLIAGKNDSLEAAKEVADYLQGLDVTINLIPYNTQRKGIFAPPDEETILAFRNYLHQLGFHTLLRLTKGRSIMAACGQLGNKQHTLKKTALPLSKSC